MDKVDSLFESLSDCNGLVYDSPFFSSCLFFLDMSDLCWNDHFYDSFGDALFLEML